MPKILIECVTISNPDKFHTYHPRSVESTPDCTITTTLQITKTAKSFAEKLPIPLTTKGFEIDQMNAYFRRYLYQELNTSNQFFATIACLPSYFEWKQNGRPHSYEIFAQPDYFLLFNSTRIQIQRLYWLSNSDHVWKKQPFPVEVNSPLNLPADSLKKAIAISRLPIIKLRHGVHLAVIGQDSDDQEMVRLSVKFPTIGSIDASNKKGVIELGPIINLI